MASPVGWSRESVRQIAVAIVDTGVVHDALVTFARGPRDRRPSHVAILVIGWVLGASELGGGSGSSIRHCGRRGRNRSCGR